MNLSIRKPATLTWRLALLLAAMLLLASGAQAAGHRGAVLVKDIRPGSAPSVTEPDCSCGGTSYAGGDLTNVRGTLYFSAEDGAGAGRHGYELWRSDGTARGTKMVKDINPGTGSSDISEITVVNRILYFSADDGVHGSELWRSDGTARGTRMVKDINPGPDGGDWGWFTAVNDMGYFSGVDGTNGGLWRSDGTEAGTGLVKGFGSPPGIFHLTNVSGTLYFAVTDGSHTELWRSDGTEAGTGVVKQGLVGDLELTDFRGTLYFAADDSVLGPALWRSDGSVPGTVMVMNFDRYAPCCFTDLHDTLYFLRSNGAKGSNDPNELWRSDGTAARTALIKRAKDRFLEPTVVKGKLYLSDNQALWRSDGTRRGTKIIRGFSGGYYVPTSLTAVKRTLYFAGADKRHGEELWRSDGTRKGTKMVIDIRHSPQDIRRHNLSSLPGTSPQSATPSSSLPRTRDTARSCGGRGRSPQADSRFGREAAIRFAWKRHSSARHCARPQQAELQEQGFPFAPCCGGSLATPCRLGMSERSESCLTRLTTSPFAALILRKAVRSPVDLLILRKAVRSLVALMSSHGRPGMGLPPA